MRSEAPVPTVGQVVAVVDAQLGSRVLLPDSMLRRRQYGVEVIWAALLAAARGRPWNQVAAGLGVPYTTVREWLRRFARRADRVHAWLCGLLPRLVDDPVLPPGTTTAAGDALAVLGALHQQMPGRWPVVEVPRVSSAEHERLLRRARAQDVALFRYRLIGPALEEGLSTKQRGKVVRGIAGQ